MEILPGINIEDVMKEIGAIGTGNATLSLSEFFENNKDVKRNLLGKGLSLVPSMVDYFNASQYNYFSNKEMSVGYNIRFNFGGCTANAMLFFPRRTSLLIPMLIRGKYTGKEEFVDIIFDEDISTLLFISTKVLKSYSNALGDYMNSEIKEEYSNLIMLLEKDIIKFIKGEAGDAAHLIQVAINFSVPETNFKGELYFILALKEVDTLAKLVKKKWS